MWKRKRAQELGLEGVLWANSVVCKPGAGVQCLQVLNCVPAGGGGLFVGEGRGLGHWTNSWLGAGLPVGGSLE